MLGSMHGELAKWAWRLIGSMGLSCCFFFFEREWIRNGGDGPMCAGMVGVVHVHVRRRMCMHVHGPVHRI